jgi:hypothetical protein
MSSAPKPAYVPPRKLLEILRDIQYEQGLALDDQRYIDTAAARGSEKTLGRIAKRFGLDLASGDFVPLGQRHLLLFGHTGSGKTTELRRYADKLSGPGRYVPIELDVRQVLDPNNLRYTDILMALMSLLLERLEKESIHLDRARTQALEDWFAERVTKEERLKEFSAKVSTSVAGKGGIPFLVKLAAAFTSDLRSNVSYKEEMRTVVQNTFTQFAEIFNELLASAEAGIEAKGRGRKVLFVVDGTDRMSLKDTVQLFVSDAEQLNAIQAHVVYTASIDQKYDGRIAGKFDEIVLSMIKPFERDGTTPAPEGRRVLREILLARAHESVFENDGAIDVLVDASGGHPRDLLRLLKYACETAEEPRIGEATARAAVDQLASDYRRLLERDDYPELVRADEDRENVGHDERLRRLLRMTAVLEYNDGAWRACHPAIRQLAGYARALAAARAAGAERP